MRLVASIAHAAFVEARKPDYDKLCAALRQADIPYVTAIGKAPGASWAIEQWAIASDDSAATHYLFCADDVAPCEDFGHVVRAAVSARPGDILCFGNFHNHPIEAQRRGLHWLKTRDGVVGQMYLLPAAHLREMRLFLRNAVLSEHLALPPTDRMTLSDDGFVNLYAMVHDAPIYVTVPALYEHLENETLFETNKDDWGRKCTIRTRPGLRSIDWTGEALECGRTNNLHHRHMLWSIRPEWWRIYRVLDRYYDPSNWRVAA